MFHQKKGLPEESEIVICTVTKIQYHSVFVSLDEYGNKSAMLHISEVSPGRIRNIKDYVKEGKVIVCKVLRKDEKRSQIDVSLRRVTESQRREKLDLIKQEQRAEKIIEFISKELKQDNKKNYETIMKSFKGQYEYLYEIFNDYVMEEISLESFNLDSKTSKLLDETIRQRIKPPEVEIKAKLHIECYDNDGINKVKDILNSIKEFASENIDIFYLGGGNYSINFKGEIYEEIEKPYELMEKLLEEQNKNFVYKLQRT